MTDLLAIITPDNFVEEEQQFLNSTTYHPTFHYYWQDQDINPEFSIKLKYPLWEAIKSQDHESIILAAQKLFEVKINKEDLAKALAVSKQKGDKAQGSAEEYAQLMQKSLNLFGIKDLEIKIVDEHGFNSRPRHREKQLIISRYIQFEYFSMEAEVRHELVHILRYRNGKHNGIKRSQNFLPTEEGLASWCQDHTNDDIGQAQHAMEYIGSTIGLNGSLRDIYNYMLEAGMSRELAWKRAARHKFGFVDTSKPGDILKPAMYFANEIMVDQLDTDSRLRLFVGKISLPEMKEHQQYNGIWSPDQLVNYFKL